MLTLRHEQIGAFQARSIADFLDRTTAYLFERFPEPCAEQGYEGVRDLVRYACEVCAAYGITDRFGVTTYLELTFHYGFDFDLDPECPWAAEILLDESLPQADAIPQLVQYLPPDDESGEEPEGAEHGR